APSILFRPSWYRSCLSRTRLCSCCYSNQAVRRGQIEEGTFMTGHSKSPPSDSPWSAPGDGNFCIGRSMLRVEDERLLRGGGCSVSDLIATSTALRLKVLRSSHAHAPLLAIDARSPGPCREWRRCSRNWRRAAGQRIQQLCHASCQRLPHV